MRALFASAIMVLALSSAVFRKIAQDSPKPKSEGQFIVASRDLPDPLFRDSVVLMLPIKEETLLAGIIINKPTKVKVRELFPDSPTLKNSDAMAYFGGPVDFDVAARSAIFRSKNPPKSAVQVFGDIYVTFDAGEILALAENAQQASTLRVFLGRAQWAPEQFEGEVARGSWHNLPASADSIFSEYPDSLWRTLIDRAEPRPVVQSTRPFLPARADALP